MNITLRQLRAFVAVARTGSFTLAAESLYISQSALSGLIKELEQTLGVRVVDRSTRRIHLSDMGRELFPLVEKILSDLDRVLTDVSERKSLKSGFVRVAAPQLMAATVLPEIIAAYNNEHPDISVKLVDSVVESVCFPGRSTSASVRNVTRTPISRPKACLTAVSSRYFPGATR